MTRIRFIMYLTYKLLILLLMRSGKKFRKSKRKIVAVLAVVGLFFIEGSTVFATDNSWMVFDDTAVAEIRFSIAPAALEWIYTWENRQSDSLHLAQLHFKNKYIDETVENIGFRLRGNTSRDSRKKSFKISFNTFAPGREFYGLDKMNLNGEHNDPSIIRSKICWDWFNDIGLIASQAAHAAVYINDEYYGLYISVEHIDDEFVDKRFTDPSGNLWKCLYPASLNYRGPNPENYYPYQDAERPYELKTNEEEYDYSQLARLIGILNNTPDADFVDSIEQILAVPGVLKYFAMNILTGSWDDYRFLQNNYYLYHEPAADKFHLIPYDYDNTFGIDWFDTDWSAVDPYNYPFNDEDGRPLMRILEIPEYRNLYTHMLEFYSAQVTDLALNEARIDSLKAIIIPWAEADLYRTYDYGFSIADFHQSYSSRPANGDHVKSGLKEFISARNTSLPAQLEYLNTFPIIYDLEYQPRQPGPEDSIYVSVAAFSSTPIPAIEIQYHSGQLTVIESYPMFPNPVAGTKIVETADCWSGVIPPLGAGGSGRFMVRVAGIDTDLSRFPRTGLIEIHATETQDNSLRINEFLASNSHTNTDQDGEYDDWVELVNLGEQAVALSGLYLTDKPDNLTKWQFPSGSTVLEPGEFLLVWCDEDEEQTGGIHTSFKLSAGGEFLAVVAEDGVSVIDSLSFGEQEPDVSFGRFPDGADNWQFFNTPTPGLSNQSGTAIATDRLVAEFRLLHNFPNPFNAVTSIQYVISKKTAVRISIRNINGQLVQILYDGVQSPGEHRISWNAMTLASGIYFCELRTELSGDILKMLLLK